jgi:hypothetical protein
MIISYQNQRIWRKRSSQQYVKFFKIIQKIDRLIYRLNMSFDWKIHFVFFVTQLKSVSDLAKNSFNRFKSSHSSSIIDIQDQYEIKRFLNKRTIRRKTEYFTKYLIRWLEYESK